MDKTAIEKMNDGDPLTNDELDHLIFLFQTMDSGLRLLGPKYHIAWSPISSKLEELRSIKSARTAKRVASFTPSSPSVVDVSTSPNVWIGAYPQDPPPTPRY